MSAEDYEVFKVLKKEAQAEGRQRRAQATDSFSEIQQLAAAHGMQLICHTEEHYSLRAASGWIMNIYPGNQRLYHDRQRPAPYLKLDKWREWDLIDVVNAAIAARAEGRR